MKEANLNALRTSHYPPRPELLDIADELGVYVEGLLRPSSGDSQRRSRRRQQIHPPNHWKVKTSSSPVTRWPCDWPGSKKSIGIWPSSMKPRRLRIRARAKVAP